MPLPVIADVGKIGFMAAIMSQLRSGANNAKVKLFTNNYTPLASSVLADFTEATFGGYVALATPTAADAGVIPGGLDNWIFGALTWTASGAGLPITIYGYWVQFDNPITLAPTLLWAQRFDTPQALIAAGNTISFVLSLADNQG